MTCELVVIDGRLGSTVQDLGRFGYQRYGVSASGAMDVPAIRLGSALVGEDAVRPAIEITASGMAVRVEAEPRLFAYAGPPATVAVDGVVIPTYRSFVARRGSAIAIRMKPGGMRGYLCVAGGIAVPQILGSASTHTRSGLGGLEGRALRAGDRLPLGDLSGECVARDLPPQFQPRYGSQIRVVLGPQDAAFTADGLNTFLSASYTVSDRSDRMGARLDGPRIEHLSGHDTISDGTMNGSVQVPGDGLPLVLLADRPTTGGYPKLATVITCDLPSIAQACPGTGIRFRRVWPEEAVGLVREADEALRQALAAIVPVTSKTRAVTAAMLWRTPLTGGISPSH